MSPELPPYEIGQARVLEYLILNDQHIHTDNTRHFRDGQLLRDFYGLAICKYDEDEHGYYLFYCNNDWIEIADTYHDSIDKAKDQADFEYKGTINDWTKR